MTGIHIVMAFFAAWRITEIITQDVICKTPREWWANRFAGKNYANFLSCPRCVSVWVCMIVALAFYYAPYVNWPFAGSMLYLIASTLFSYINTIFNQKYMDMQRKIVIMPDLSRVDWGHYQPGHGIQILKQYIQSPDAQAQPSMNPIPSAIKGSNGR